MSMPTPERSPGIIDLSTLAKPEPAPTGPPCSRCGLPMPELTDDLKAMLRSNPGISMTHEVCPGQAPEAPEGRYFEVRVQIVEVTEDEPGPASHPAGEKITRVEELITFRAGARWPDLDTAMRPLALLLGEKWMIAEKQAKLADTPPTPL